MTFAVGDKVEWTSSNTRKVGEIVAVVPAGKIPSDVGFPKAGGGGIGRKQVSYIARGRKRTYRDEPYGSNAVYWPMTSLLKPLDCTSESGG